MVTNWGNFGGDGGGEGGGGGTGGGVSGMYRTFDFTNIGTPILLGVAPAGAVVGDIIVEIVSAFDPGVAITVGTLAAPELFMAAGENYPAYSGNQYCVKSGKYCIADTGIYVAVSGQSLSGTGNIKINVA